MFQLGCQNRVCFQNEILSGLTVALALVPEAVAFAFVNDLWRNRRDGSGHGRSGRAAWR
jgi:hypothetical protein